VVKAILVVAVLVVVLAVLLYLVNVVRSNRLEDPAAAVVNQGGPPQEANIGDARNLNEILETIRRKYKVPALVAALIQNGKITGLGATGVRRAGHSERVTPNDRFHIGSCTKSMTATLCAILVQQGKLQWDTTVAASFPSLASDIRPEYRPVTLEQLLNHRAGLPEDREPDDVVWPKITSLTGPLREQRQSLAKIVLQQPPTAPPGARHQYSNAGYVIAGAMCEQAAGQSWEDLMRQLLFQPLGMATAGFGPPGDAAKVDEPWGHLLDGFTWKPLSPGPDVDNPAVIGPAGTVHCSLGDWARYAILHLQGERGEAKILPAEPARKLHTPAPGDEYAFGWLVVDRDWGGGKVLAHSGSNGYGTPQSGWRRHATVVTW
jgi:CubicO group peptidase (beta-lactamase class C family)